MATQWPDFLTLKKLRDLGLVPDRPVVVEVGQANWYNDVPAAVLRDAVAHYGTPDDVTDLDAALAEPRPDLFRVNEVYYAALLRRPTLTAFDMHGRERALKYDLNDPVPARHWWGADLVVNTGTVEHIFDAAQALKTCHDLCKPVGLMLHTFPVLGWVDHGFWTVNPTLLNDLAAANGYETVSCCLWESPRHEWAAWPLDPALLLRAQRRCADVTAHVVWRKVGAAPFRVPRQGRYRGE